MTGSMGTMMINGKTYTQIRLMPELRFGKIGIVSEYEEILVSSHH